MRHCGGASTARSASAVRRSVLTSSKPPAQPPLWTVDLNMFHMLLAALMRPSSSSDRHTCCGRPSGLSRICASFPRRPRAMSMRSGCALLSSWVELGGDTSFPRCNTRAIEDLRPARPKTLSGCISAAGSGHRARPSCPRAPAGQLGLYGHSQACRCRSLTVAAGETAELSGT